MKYLLDTNICVFVIRQKSPHLLTRFPQFMPNDLGISTVTLAELRYGADRSNNPAKNHSLINGLLVALDVASFDARAADVYGVVRADLESRGCMIGSLDMMIAAHALCLGVPVVTNNIGEFSRVPGLSVEDWTRP